MRFSSGSLGSAMRFSSQFLLAGQVGALLRREAPLEVLPLGSAMRFSSGAPLEVQPLGSAPLGSAMRFSSGRFSSGGNEGDAAPDPQAAILFAALKDPAAL